MRTVVTRRAPRVLLASAALVALVATACQPPAPPPAPPSPDPGRAQVAAGLGAWWDVWDWSPTWVRSRNPNARPPKTLSHVDQLARLGVQTLYIQTSTFKHPAKILDPTLLRAIRDRANSHGMRVVAWYLPEFKDLRFDLERLGAAARFGFNGLGVDIESTANPNVADRSEKLVIISRVLRGAFPSLPLFAIPVTPVIWEELNRSWWPNFPYKELVPFYDAWLPMAYWSFRTPESGWRNSYRYTYESIVRLRRLTGRPDLPVHPIGGQADGIDGVDVFWMNAAMEHTGAIGGSVYDDVTTHPSLWGALSSLRREIVK